MIIKSYKKSLLTTIIATALFNIATVNASDTVTFSATPESENCPIPTFWQAGNSYSKGDVVLFDNIVYVALQDNSYQPAEGEDWALSSCHKKSVFDGPTNRSMGKVTFDDFDDVTGGVPDPELDIPNPNNVIHFTRMKHVTKEYRDAVKLHAKYKKAVAEKDRRGVYDVLKASFTDLPYEDMHKIYHMFLLNDNKAEQTAEAKIGIQAREGYTIVDTDQPVFILHNPFIRKSAWCEFRTPRGHFWMKDVMLDQRECAEKKEEGEFTLWMYSVNEPGSTYFYQTSTRGFCQKSTSGEQGPWVKVDGDKKACELNDLNSELKGIKDPNNASNEVYQWVPYVPMLFSGNNGFGYGYEMRSEPTFQQRSNVRIRAPLSMRAPSDAIVRAYQRTNYNRSSSGGFDGWEKEVKFPFAAQSAAPISDLKSSEVINSGTPALVNDDILIRARVNGGYYAYANVSYVNPQGQRVDLKNHYIPRGDWFNHIVPAGSSQLFFNFTRDTGLLWNPRREIVSINNLGGAADFCLDLWGTSLKPRWALQNECHYN